MKIKYPRTLHLPQSRQVNKDDKVLKDINSFIGKELIVTIKMDGENSTISREYYHARSIDSKYHSSRSWLLKFHNEIKHLIPEGWRICGENLYAKHSIKYDNLDSYFLGFSIWNENNICLDWDSTLEWFELLGISPVPELIRINNISDSIIYNIVDMIDINTQEGFVIRNKKEFHYNDFSNNVAKWVRPKHVQTNKHWLFQTIIPNKLKI